MKNTAKISKLIYIYLYFYGFALASSRRDLDAPRRASEVATPKKRTLKTHRAVATKQIEIDTWGKNDSGFD